MALEIVGKEMAAGGKAELEFGMSRLRNRSRLKSFNTSSILESEFVARLNLKVCILDVEDFDLVSKLIDFNSSNELSTSGNNS